LRNKVVESTNYILGQVVRDENTTPYVLLLLPHLLPAHTNQNLIYSNLAYLCTITVTDLNVLQ